MTMRLTSGLSALALATLFYTTAAQAQSGTMAKPMPMAKEKVYTGCVAAGSMTGSFMLSNAVEEAPMGGAMAKDAMGKDAMAKDGMAKDAMGKGAMAPHMMAIASTAVDLSKHVGHKVSVTVVETGMAKADGMAGHDGMAKPDTMGKPDAMAKPGAMATPAAVMAVSSLRMVASTCTM
ncbi:MAG: hypothetical protein ABI880_12340 [Acidobacteriota bacterium]